MIRPATAADAPAIAALEAELFGGEAWNLEQVQSEIAGPGRRAWVVGADKDERSYFSGYVVTMTVGDITDLQRVGVAPAARRTGVATELLDVALAAAREDGADRMLLEVAEDNVGALAFYAAHGFTQIDRRPRYYRHEIAALVLQKDLAE